MRYSIMGGGGGAVTWHTGIGYYHIPSTYSSTYGASEYGYGISYNASDVLNGTKLWVDTQ